MLRFRISTLLLYDYTAQFISQKSKIFDSSLYTRGPFGGSAALFLNFSLVSGIHIIIALDHAVV